MSVLQFASPPLPFYIHSGEDTYAPGQHHPNRRSIGVFDMLFVTRGTLYIAEEDRKWEVQSGNVLILRPDRHHYAASACTEETHFYWLHFQPAEPWEETAEPSLAAAARQSNPFIPERFSISLPRYCELSNGPDIYSRLRDLLALSRQSSASARWKEQLLFQHLLLELDNEHNPHHISSVHRIAEKAASYLRQNYRSAITYPALGEALHFHPTYISRCMKQVFGCTPLEYLVYYRLEQAKRMLMNTDMPIGRIAEEVGFENSSYFTRCFHRIERMTPRQFRKQFRF